MREPAAPARMRAAVITGPRALEVREVETPAPAADQVLIRVEGCGVCGSSLPLWEGREWFTYPARPGAPGHEGWGTVVAAGPATRSVRAGDRVGFLSDRAFAEYDVAAAACVVKLPASLAGHDAPAEALGCAMNIWRRSEIEAGQTVAVIGVGFLGALLVQLAARAGARVIAISQRAYSLELARRMGAAEAIELGPDDAADTAPDTASDAASDAAIVARVEALTGNEGCERVIELTGTQRPLALAAKLCRVRGRLVIAGFHQDGPRQVDMFLWNWRGLDVINAHERAPAVYVQGMAAALDGVTSGRLDPAPLYTHRVPLARAGEAFELLRQRPAGFVKALVIP